MGLFDWLSGKKTRIIKIQSDSTKGQTDKTHGKASPPPSVEDPDEFEESAAAQNFWSEVTTQEPPAPDLEEILDAATRIEPEPQQPAAQPASAASSIHASLGDTESLSDLELMQRLRERAEKKTAVQQQKKEEIVDQELVANLEKQRTFARTVTQNQLVTEADLATFFNDYGKRIRHEFIGALMVEAGLLSESRMSYLLSRHFKILSIDLQLYEILPSVLDTLDRTVARAETVLPVDAVGNVLTVAACNPFNQKLFKKLESLTGRVIRPVYCSQEQLNQYIEMYYPSGSTIMSLEELGLVDQEEEEAAETVTQPDAPQADSLPDPEPQAETPQADPESTPEPARKPAPSRKVREEEAPLPQFAQDPDDAEAPSPQPSLSASSTSIGGLAKLAPAITDKALNQRKRMRTSVIARKWVESFTSPTSPTKAAPVSAEEFDAMFGPGGGHA